MQPLSYLCTTGGLIWTAACVLFGILFAWLSCRIINSVPASWLCDYGETPSEELLSGHRVKFAGSGIILSVITAVCFVLCRLQFNKGYTIYFVVLSLIIVVSLMIAICDIKYTIIPDQFTIALAVLSLSVSVYDIVRGFGILHKSWWSPLAGAAIGAGVMIMIDLLGMIIYKKTGMGFGDVKLFAAVGLLTGFPGTILAFVISLVGAAVCFLVIIVLVKILSRKSSDEAEQQQTDESAGAEGDKTGDAKPSASAAEEEDLPSDLKDAADSGKPEEKEAAGQDKDSEGAEDASESDEGSGGGSYFAFGPYIALATICYIVFYDFIYEMFDMYMRNFK